MSKGASITFSFVDQSSPSFLRPTWEGLWLINYFSVPTSIVTENQKFDLFLLLLFFLIFTPRAKFSTFFALSNFRGRAFPKNSAHLNTPASRHDRPTDLAFWKTSNGHISAMGHPIHFMFGSRVGFSGTADRMALFTVSQNLRWRLAAILENFKWPYLWNELSDLLS